MHTPGIPAAGTTRRRARSSHRRLRLRRQTPLISRSGRRARWLPPPPGRADHRTPDRRPLRGLPCVAACCSSRLFTASSVDHDDLKVDLALAVGSEQAPDGGTESHAILVSTSLCRIMLGVPVQPELTGLSERSARPPRRTRRRRPQPHQSGAVRTGEGLHHPLHRHPVPACALHRRGVLPLGVDGDRVPVTAEAVNEPAVGVLAAFPGRHLNSRRARDDRIEGGRAFESRRVRGRNAPSQY